MKKRIETNKTIEYFKKQWLQYLFKRGLTMIKAKLQYQYVTILFKKEMQLVSLLCKSTKELI